MADVARAWAQMCANVNRAGFYFFILILALAPLPFGLVEPAYQSIWAIAFGCVLVVGALCPHDAHSATLGRTILLILALIFLAWIALGGAFPYFFAHCMGLAKKLSWLSVGASLAGLGNFLLMLLTIGCCLIFVRAQGRPEIVLGGMAVSALFYAAIGLVQATLAPNDLLWGARPGYAGLVLGSFVNRNTTAAYFGIALIIWAVFALRILLRSWSDGEGVPIRSKSFWICVLASMLMAVCLVKTGSRAGTVLSVAGLVFAFIAYLSGVKNRLVDRRINFKVVVTIALACVAMIGLFATPLSDRLSDIAFADDSRSAVAAASDALIQTHFWSGAGPGSFLWLFPPYRPDAMPITSVWTHAHNTYLELAIEYGVPATALTLAVVAVAFLLLLHRSFGARHSNRSFAIIAVSCLAIALLHGFVDFPLFVSGYAITLVALVTSVLFSRQNASAPNPRPSSQRRKPRNSTPPKTEARFKPKFPETTDQA